MRKLVYIASPLSGKVKRKLAETLGVPARQVSAEEIQSMDFSPTQGMVMG
ncbi:MAG: hypothetical protein K2L38_00750 [Dysosmobacter sp.]|nr:hypothetical protein [Dysosmobacter sp.]